MRLIRRQQIEDVPELIQRIQLVLPSKDAARTCILSKSWLHAWYTSPAIRFCPSVDSLKKKNQRKYMRWIHLALLRYHRDNLPITSLDLQLGIHTTYRAAQKLIMRATSSKSSPKELHLAILAAVSFTLPDEIFSSENLNTLRLELISPDESRSLHISSHPAIQCTNLRVLE
ncbi:pleckstrin domain superfamily protein, partial [Tanacetum coccineum]